MTGLAHVRVPEESFVPEASFTEFPKISRLFRPIVITEKIDGTNSAVVVSETSLYGYGADEIVGPGIVVNKAPFEGHFDGWDPVYVYAQSRKQVISPEQDNFGFAKWVRENAHKLAAGLGVGVHFGEWWGSGIQRKYGLDEKRFSLFNVSRWGEYEEANGFGETVIVNPRPKCCHVVPVLAEADTFAVDAVIGALASLEDDGSRAAPGFMDPEGVVLYHKHSNSLFKATIKGDDKGKEHGA
jgi:hypothetical protein